MSHNKLKVVWLCHFTNEEIQRILHCHKTVQSFAPWIPLSLKMLEGDERFDIYVISPHEYISSFKKINLRGIHYYFYNPGIPLLGRHWPAAFKWDYWTNFAYNKRITKRFINQINPDIIHLHGVENAYYSSTIFQFIDRYPTIISIQGFISLFDSSNYFVRKRAVIEQNIIKKETCAFVRNHKMDEYLKTINPSILTFWSWYPFYHLDVPLQTENKKYDIVYWGSVTKAKGIGDLIDALSIIKDSKEREFSLCVIGAGEIDYYKQYATEKGVGAQIEWTGFLPSQKDVYEAASMAKISVLPTYHDNMPGGIVEAMYLGLPVISYDVDCNPEINEKEEVISLVPKNDINALAKEIVFLLDEKDLRKERSNKGKLRFKEMFDPDRDTFNESLIIGYKSAIDIFYEHQR